MSKPAGKVKLTETQVEVLRLLVKYPDAYLRESLSFWLTSLDGYRDRFQHYEAVKPSTVAILKRHKLIARGKGKIGLREYRITPLGRRVLKESSK
ncbi:hypothetical protein LCGC14_2435080 [marine sediment metagenome]|uniref:Uncharacterized protein n=1 Tax=marine sediment metagenome TaxID=412755 RepID=A0A0F9C844_9ZZZZ